jgi:hypothetical protein
VKVAAGGEIFEFDGNRFLNVEVMAIEKATGMTAVEWQDGLNRGSMTAATALIWILRRRRGDASSSGPGILRFEDVVFDAESLDMMVEDEDEGKDSPPETSSDTTPADPSSAPTTITSSPSSTVGDFAPGNATD